MKSKNSFILIMLFALVTSITVSSCGSSKKCDGKKATKTRMGNM